MYHSEGENYMGQDVELNALSRNEYRLCVLVMHEHK